MANETPNQSTKPADQTFRNYAPSQAQNYAQFRSPYPQQLISTVIDYHTSSSPDPDTALTTLVDVGCGPGPATRVLAASFDKAIGLDPGQSMIDAAKQLGGQTKTGNDIQFGLSSAEDIDQALQNMGAWDGQTPFVDLITSATAAHWFDMPHFFAAAAKVLKPGGSIIVWSSGNSHIDERKYPADVVEQTKAIMKDFEENVISKYELDGNRLTRGLYKDLKMPWDVDVEKQKELGIDVFDKEKSVRKTWNEEGRLEDGLQNGWMWGAVLPWKFIKMAIGTASPITRFREHNKQALESGKMQDPVDETIEKMRDVVGRDQEVFEGGMDCCVVMVKKKT